LIRAGLVDLGITELDAVVAWFENSRLAYFRLIATLWLAEGYLVRGETVSARPLIEQVLQTCREIGYRHFEGLAHRLLGDCLTADEPLAATDHVKTALRIFEQIGARNDVAKALVTRAALRQRTGDIAGARQLLDEAHAIFVTLGTRVEPDRVKVALSALDGGMPIWRPASES
jgi:ATP/maltotriose-dependent transcriptional regulator MalT